MRGGERRIDDPPLPAVGGEAAASIASFVTIVGRLGGTDAASQ